MNIKLWFVKIRVVASQALERPFAVFIFAGVTVASCLFAAERAQAATVLFDVNSDVTGVDNLIVDGTTYNITFAFYSPGYSGSSDTTFLGNSAGALDAVNAIDAALNISTGTLIASGGGRDFEFFVEELSVWRYAIIWPSRI